MNEIPQIQAVIPDLVREARVIDEATARLVARISVQVSVEVEVILPPSVPPYTGLEIGEDEVIRNAGVYPDSRQAVSVTGPITINGLPAYLYGTISGKAYDMAEAAGSPADREWLGGGVTRLWWQDGKYFLLWGGNTYGLWYVASAATVGPAGLGFAPYLGIGASLDGLDLPGNMATTCGGTFTLVATETGLLDPGYPEADEVGQELRQYDPSRAAFDYYVATAAKPNTHWEPRP